MNNPKNALVKQRTERSQNSFCYNGRSRNTKIYSRNTKYTQTILFSLKVTHKKTLVT